MNNDPLYKSQNDLTNRDLFIHEVEVSWKRQFRKLPGYYIVGFAVCPKTHYGPRLPCLGFCDIAITESKHTDEDNYLLPLSKFMAAKELCKKLSVPYAVIVRFVGSFTDLFCKVNLALDYTTSYDSSVSDLLIEIPMKGFKRI